MGKKKQPTYRVVAADSRSPRNGRFIEIIGFYDPRQEPSDVRVDNDRALDWLQKGAQPTDSVRKILQISGAWESFTGEPRPAPPPPKPAKVAKPAVAPDVAPSGAEPPGGAPAPVGSIAGGGAADGGAIDTAEPEPEAAAEETAQLET
jgi:small subunit ribosomal protein S16